MDNIYFKKYIKYKTKYLNLIQKGTGYNDIMKNEINKEKIAILKSLWTCLFLNSSNIKFLVDDMIYYSKVEEDPNDPHNIRTKDMMFTFKKNIIVWYKRNINKNQSYIEVNRLSKQELKDELSKSLNKNTTLKCKIYNKYLLNPECNIDWKVFSQANITLYKYTGHGYKIEKFNYDLKDLPTGFTGLLKSYNSEPCDIELTLPLDIDYIITKTKGFAFLSGTHKRLGEKSEVSSLDDDVLSLIMKNI
jgi:hypothetical protein